MSKHWNGEILGVMVDMAGCPNRCRHCWLGTHRNGDMSREDLYDIADQFRSWRDENGAGIRQLAFTSWWREPDFRDDYRELANRTIPLSELTRRFGDPDSQKLYDRDDLISRFMHQWGMAYMEGRK